MSAFKNLAGQEFGMLEVLSLETIADNGVTWLCRCRCDALRSVFQRSLLSGHVTCCKDCRPPRPARAPRPKLTSAHWDFDQAELRIGNGGEHPDPLIKLPGRNVALRQSMLRDIAARGLTIGAGLDPDAIADIPPAWIAALTAAGLVERVVS